MSIIRYTDFMKLPQRHSHRIAVITIAALLIISLGWWGLWTIAASQYAATIDGWIKSGRDDGYQITYDSRSLFGFPRHVVLRFSNLHWKNPDGIDFHAPVIDIGALPWLWDKFDAKFKGHAEIDAPLDQESHMLVLGGESGIAHVHLGKDGNWTYSHIDITKATLGRTPDYLFLADTLTAWAERPEEEPKNHKDTGLTLSGEAINLTLPPSMPSPFGSKMVKLTTDLRIMDAVPDFRRKDSVAVWNRDSGVVEFDKLDMNWGPLELSAKGTMGFDDDLQPEGAFASTLGNRERVLKALTEAGFIASNQQDMLTSAMALFAKPSHADGVDGVEVPIAVQLGGLFLGPVKVFSFPEIIWPGSTPEPVPVLAPAPATTAPSVP